MTNEEAIKAIKANYPSGGYEDLRKALDMAIKALQEQKVGKWNLYRCSECKRVCSDFIRGTYWIIRKPNYCPNCGAKMEGAEE